MFERGTRNCNHQLLLLERMTWNILFPTNYSLRSIRSILAFGQRRGFLIPSFKKHTKALTENPFRKRSRNYSGSQYEEVLNQLGKKPSPVPEDSSHLIEDNASEVTRSLSNSIFPRSWFNSLRAVSFVSGLIKTRWLSQVKIDTMSWWKAVVFQCLIVEI